MSIWHRLFGSVRDDAAIDRTDALDRLSERMERIAQAAIEGKPLPESPATVRKETYRLRHEMTSNEIANTVARRGKAP